MTEKMQAFETSLATFCSSHNLTSARWPKLRRAQVFEISSLPRFLIYAKDSALQAGWWGIAFTVYKKLYDSGQDWHLVLLVRDGEEGYVLSNTQINGMVTGLSQNVTEYIIHEAEATAGSHFMKFDHLFQQLLS